MTIKKVKPTKRQVALACVVIASFLCLFYETWMVRDLQSTFAGLMDSSLGSDVVTDDYFYYSNLYNPRTPKQLQVKAKLIEQKKQSQCVVPDPTQDVVQLTMYSPESIITNVTQILVPHLHGGSARPKNNHSQNGPSDRPDIVGQASFSIFSWFRNLFGSPPTAKREDFAICEFSHPPHFQHFPHAMQQYYACWSFWRQHPDKYGVLLQIDNRREKALIRKRQPSTSFVPGFRTVLRELFGIQFVSSLKQLRPKLSRTQRRLPITSYAIQIPGEQSYVAHPDDLKDLRDEIVDGYFGTSTRTRIAQCPPKSNHANATSPDRPDRDVPMDSSISVPLPRVGILNRLSTRSLLNIDAIEDAVRSELGSNVTVRIADFEDTPFLAQAHFFASIDLLITGHGAQETGIPFLPHCAAVLEIFPKGYFVPEFFGALSAISNHAHYYLYLGGHDWRAEVEQLRNGDTGNGTAGRGIDLCPPVDKIRHGIRALTRAWRECCYGDLV